MALKFEWDERKSASNQRSHQVSFEEAKTVFSDENAVEFYDPDHSDAEDRYLMLGISAKLRVLIVSYCYRKDHEAIRIISARKANSKEEKQYGGDK